MSCTRLQVCISPVTFGHAHPGIAAVTFGLASLGSECACFSGSGVTGLCQVMLLQGADKFHLPLHLQVSEVSESARKAVELAGGSVTTVYYNQLGLRALMTPDWFAEKGRQLPRAARPPPKVGVKYDQVGELPPVITQPT